MEKPAKKNKPQGYDMEAAAEFDAEGMLNPSSARHKRRIYRYKESNTEKNGKIKQTDEHK
jgi:hypothetical protein